MSLYGPPEGGRPDRDSQEGSWFSKPAPRRAEDDHEDRQDRREPTGYPEPTGYREPERDHRRPASGYPQPYPDQRMPPGGYREPGQDRRDHGGPPEGYGYEQADPGYREPDPYGDRNQATQVFAPVPDGRSRHYPDTDQTERRPGGQAFDETYPQVRGGAADAGPVPYRPGPDPYPDEFEGRGYAGHPGDEQTWAAGGTRPDQAPGGIRSRTGLMVGLIIGAVVLLCAGGIIAFLLPGSGSPKRQQAAPAGPASATSSSDPTNSANFVKGACLTNQGTTQTPQLRVTDCAAGTYEVLARFDGTDDKEKCRTVPGATDYYYYSTGTAQQDYVLCFKKR